MGVINDFLISKKKESEVIEFYKEAFCVDGKIKILESSEKFKIIAVVELNDSKRGRFFVGALKLKET